MKKLYQRNLFINDSMIVNIIPQMIFKLERGPNSQCVTISHPGILTGERSTILMRVLDQIRSLRDIRCRSQNSRYIGEECNSASALVEILKKSRCQLQLPTLNLLLRKEEKGGAYRHKRDRVTCDRPVSCDSPLTDDDDDDDSSPRCS